MPGGEEVELLMSLRLRLTLETGRTQDRNPAPLSLLNITFAPYLTTDASIVSKLEEEEEEEEGVLVIVDAGTGDSDVSAYERIVSQILIGWIDGR
jgi:hypothetical protein